MALDAQVRLRIPTANAIVDTRIRDLSENGVFIVTKETRPIGTGVELQIEVQQDGLAVRARGVIVHEVSPEDATEARPAGVGVMFVELFDDSEVALRELMKHGKPI